MGAEGGLGKGRVGGLEDWGRGWRRVDKEEGGRERWGWRREGEGVGGA